jgi:hypothetical protein
MVQLDFCLESLNKLRQLPLLSSKKSNVLL